MGPNLPTAVDNSFPDFPHASNTPSTSAQSTPPATTSPSTGTSSIFRSTEATYSPSATPPADSNLWNHMGVTTRHAIIAIIIIGLIIALGIGFWLVRERQRRAQARPNDGQPGMLPLYNLHPPTNAAGAVVGRAPGGDAPPSYEEVVPPHLRVATGPPRMLHGGEAEADDGVVADGKTPLSEIPFEDVVLEPSSSSSSSSSSANQAFNAMHHNGVGDTRGHTNS